MLHAATLGPPGETGAPPRHVRFREARFEDHAGIAALESRWGLVAKSAADWRHLWLANPVYASLGSGWRIGWILEDDDGQIVGAVSNIPLAYELGGRRLLVASGRNWVADAPYRGAALSLLDRVIDQPGVDLYLNTTNSAASTDVVTSFGCLKVPVGRWDRSALWTTHHQAWLASGLAARGVPLAEPLARVLAVPVRLSERLRGRRPSVTDVPVSALDRFDDRFDDFWGELTGAHPHQLLAVRTREMLEWHHGPALRDGKVWIAAVLDGRRLVAYATFQRTERPAWGRRVRLVDFQSLDGTTAALLPLLAWGLERCRAARVHTLEVVGRWLDDGEPLAGVAPCVQTLPAWKFFYRANDAALAAALAEPRAWSPSLFDGDASL